MVAAGPNESWYLRRSLDSGLSWSTIEQFSGTFQARANSLCEDLSGNIYVCGLSGVANYGFATVRSGTLQSSAFGTVDNASSSFLGIAGNGNCEYYSVIHDSITNKIFVAGYLAPGGSNPYGIIKSGSGATGSFAYIDSYPQSIYHNLFLSGNNLFVAGVSGTLINEGEGKKIIRKSTNKLTSSFSNYFFGLVDDDGYMPFKGAQLSTKDNIIYIFGGSGSEDGQKYNHFVNFTYNDVGTATFQSSTFEYLTPYIVPSCNFNVGSVDSVVDPYSGFVYVCFTNPPKMYLYRFKATSNSASIGPIFFNTSYAYVKSELSGNTETAYGLSNVAEFPHSNGLFQMKNMILGTVSSGKVGTSDDSIIKTKHIGSTVRIMWPHQQNADYGVSGYGDLSAGQAIGKLTNNFEPGDFIDVTKFDHMSLYCYLQKQASGTIDDVVIQVERKPLKNIGFAVDQNITQTTTGSISEYRLRDVQYKKQIDYGDLSIKEIAWPIDVDLKNIKELRISAKHANGQSDDRNKNFIVYGRFILSSKDTNET